VARLVHEKRVTLDDPVSTWIDDFPNGDDVTLLQLMTHRAGVPHRVTTPDEEVVPMSAEDIVERVKQQGLLCTPGSARVYSTAGYSVVARIIELVTGKSYGEAMRELLFEPLGMQGTVHVDNRFVLEERASSYLHGPNGMQNAPLKDLSFLVGGGSLHSTVDDVLRFGRACLERRGRALRAATTFSHQRAACTGAAGRPGWRLRQPRDAGAFSWHATGRCAAQTAVSCARSRTTSSSRPTSVVKSSSSATARVQFGPWCTCFRVGARSACRVNERAPPSHVVPRMSR
jgi:CubicO group peptidase (beta-lactamase class C family)